MFSIKTNASGIGLGAVLTQSDETKTWTVAYTSRILSDTKTQYSATKREGLAVVWAVNHFKSYLMGMPFLIITDRNPLKSLRMKANLEGQMIWFAEKLLSYNYDIVY